MFTRSKINFTYLEVKGPLGFLITLPYYFLIIHFKQYEASIMKNTQTPTQGNKIVIIKNNNSNDNNSKKKEEVKEDGERTNERTNETLFSKG